MKFKYDSVFIYNFYLGEENFWGCWLVSLVENGNF